MFLICLALYFLLTPYFKLMLPTQVSRPLGETETPLTTEITCQDSDGDGVNAKTRLTAMLTPWSAKTPLNSDLELLNAPADGFSLNIKWNEFEPTEGNFNWTNLDTRFAEANTYGKKIALRIFAGPSTPQWVYDTGAQSITYIETNRESKRCGQQAIMPLPWDALMLEKWSNLIQAVGQRYRNNPAFQRIGMAGPTEDYAEMILPTACPGELCCPGKPCQQSVCNGKTWVEAGYSNDKIVAAWKQVIDAYGQAFPQGYFSLSLNPLRILDSNGKTVGPTIEPAKELVNYGLNQYGWRFWVQGTWLSDVFPNLADPSEDYTQLYELIARNSQETNVGFQFSERKMSDSPDALKKAIERAINAKITYLEMDGEHFKNVSEQPYIKSGTLQLRTIQCGKIDCNDNNSSIYPGAVEICDNLDNNCNLSIDEDISSRLCLVNHQGVCAQGTETCSAGVWVGCSLPQTEICGNGIDEDCNGTDLECADITPPTGTISINAGAPKINSLTVTLTLSAEDLQSGVSKMQFSNDGTTYSAEEDYSTTKTWDLASGADGERTVYAKFKNSAGLWSVPVSDTIILGTTADLNRNTKVNSQDIAILLSSWGRTDKPTKDINQDNIINTQDLIQILAGWTESLTQNVIKNPLSLFLNNILNRFSFSFL